MWRIYKCLTSAATKEGGRGGLHFKVWLQGMRVKIEKPDILKLFSFACRTEDFSLKRRTCPVFAGRLATLDMGNVQVLDYNSQNPTDLRVTKIKQE